MGKYSPQISVTKGLPPDMQHLKLKTVRKRKGKLSVRRRTIDESRVVEVAGWRLPGRQHRYGVFQFSISSCNACDVHPIAGGWPDATEDRISRRLNGDGFAKGRVLYLLGEDWQRDVSTWGVLTFHLPRPGTIRVLHIQTCNALWPNRRTIFMVALLACGQIIARESGDGRSSRVEWVVRDRRAANDAKARFGFRETGRDGEGYHLALTEAYV